MNDRQSDIIGYEFCVLVEKGETGFVATAPGVGGVYEEGVTEAEAIKNAVETACALFDSRHKLGDLITEDSQFLKVIRRSRGSVQLMPQFAAENCHTQVCLLPA